MIDASSQKDRSKSPVASTATARPSWPLRVFGHVIYMAAAFAALHFAAGSARADLTPGDHLDLTLLFAGQTRLYDVHVPLGYDGTSAVPLVVDIHGLTLNKTWQANFSGFKSLSNVEGFIVTYPQGLFGNPSDPEAPNGTVGVDPPESLGPCWNAGVGAGACRAAGVDDVGFLRELVAAIAAQANIDLGRVYATGLSNGGAMAHVLACQASDVFTAVAPLALPLPYDPLSGCAPARPVPVLHFAGIDDVLVPYEGCGPATTPCSPGATFTRPSAAESFAHWRSVNACVSVPDLPIESVFVQGTSSCETDTSCAGGVETGLCSINGRSFPMSPSVSGHILYLNEDGLDLAQIAWDFLSRFQTPAAANVPSLRGWGIRAAAILLLAAGFWRMRHSRTPICRPART